MNDTIRQTSHRVVEEGEKEISKQSCKQIFVCFLCCILKNKIMDSKLVLLPRKSHAVTLQLAVASRFHLLLLTLCEFCALLTPSSLVNRRTALVSWRHLDRNPAILAPAAFNNCKSWLRQGWGKATTARAISSVCIVSSLLLALAWRLTRVRTIKVYFV